VVLSVDAALDHPLLEGVTEGVLRAALGKLDAVLQAPGVQLLVGAAGGPVKVVAVGVLESHLRLEVVPSPADAISMAYQGEGVNPACNPLCCNGIHRRRCRSCCSQP
jgi:hypothetical protein